VDFKKGWLEKREYERVKDVLKIMYCPVDSDTAEVSDDYRDTTVEKIIQDKKTSQYVQAMTEDISKGGLSIVTDENMESGQKIIIDMFLPQMSKPVKILCEVRHVDPTSKGSTTHRAGLKIVSMSKTDIKRLETHIMGLRFGRA
jgi:c-di-GMP-binding flagellar brake protein YcgR